MPVQRMQNISNSGIAVKFPPAPALDSLKLRRGMLVFAICVETLLTRSQLQKSASQDLSIICSWLGFPRPPFFCHGKDAAAVRRRHLGVASEGGRRGGLHARPSGSRHLRGRGLAQRERTRTGHEFFFRASDPSGASGRGPTCCPRTERPGARGPRETKTGTLETHPRTQPNRTPNRRINAEPVQSLDAISPDLYLQKHRERLHSRSEAGLHSATWVWD